ncbi:MAG: hypothetical protein MR450_00795 [Prevotella sp.]|nr:hypothetical protein [Prevotella sp.]MDY4039099.1 hypothetical protein [Prevotella sp.]
MEIPKDFSHYTEQLMGSALYHILADAMQQEAPVSIRTNPFKTIGRQFQIPLQRGPVAWCPNGTYLLSRPNFTFDPLLHAGLYYVQEASSMFLHTVLGQLTDRPVTMLDLCAAPGGKSTVARSALPEGSLLIANEPERTRANILAENISKFGHADVMVTNNYPRDFRRTRLRFDVILADVPCSGEGMFRKDPGAIAEWSPQNVEKCWRLQREIVRDIWPCLKPGGYLIYSTCTFNDKEDEQNANWIADELGATFVRIPTPTDWNITGSLTDANPMYRFIPGKTEGEGLFMAVLQKDGDGDDTGRGLKKLSRRVPDKDVPTEWLQQSEQFGFFIEQDEGFAIPERWQEAYLEARKALRLMTAGIHIGTRKGHNWIPGQALALSCSLNKDAFPAVEVTTDQAIAYLRKETVALPPDLPRGFTLLTYRDFPLGFEKHLGHRANNLYPAEWRIKSSHIPETNDQVIAL